MSRHFTRTLTESITFAPGAMSGFVGGPSTFAVLWRATTASKGTLADARTAADYVAGSWRCEVTGREWYAYNGASNYTQCQAYTSGVWRIDAWTKAAGNSMVRAHYAPLGSAWTHTDYSPKTDSATAISKIVVGNGTLTGPLNGDVAAATLIGRVLSDAELETFWGGLSSWYTAIGSTNATLWAFNQPDVSIPVVDLTGDGADQTAISGTSIAADPPGWSYALVTDCTVGVLLPSLGYAATGTGSSTAAAQINLPAINADFRLAVNPMPPMMTGTCTPRTLSGTPTARTVTGTATQLILRGTASVA